MVTTNNVARKEESNSTNGYTSSNSIPTTPVSYASAKKKKKMGKVAKGAIIGAGTGAVVGAIVSKIERIDVSCRRKKVVYLEWVALEL